MLLNFVEDLRLFLKFGYMKSTLPTFSLGVSFKILLVLGLKLLFLGVSALLRDNAVLSKNYNYNNNCRELISLSIPGNPLRYATCNTRKLIHLSMSTGVPVR